MSLKWPSGCAHLLVHIRRLPNEGAGVGFLLRVPGGGGSPGGARGWQGVCGEFRGRGGGLNIFFRAEIPTKTRGPA